MRGLMFSRHRFHGLGSGFELLLHRAYEANTFPRQGFDQALVSAIVANRGARRVHPAIECRFRDDASLPNRGKEIVAAHHPLSRPDQKYQQVEDLRLDRDEAVTPAQLAPVDIKDKIFEAVEQDRDLLAGAALGSNPTTALLPQK